MLRGAFPTTKEPSHPSFHKALLACLCDHHHNTV